MSDDYRYVFAILFLALGPLKTIPVFFALTHDADLRYRVHLAFQSFVVATGLVLFIAIGAVRDLESWRVSTDALIIAGGVILFVSALRQITTFDLKELPQPPPMGAPSEPRSRPKPGWMGKPTLSPLVIPTIIPSAGVVAILFFAARADGDPAYHKIVFLMLGLMMVLNLVGMLLAGPIMRIVGLPLLEIIGWIFSVLQAGLAVQTILNALRRLHIVP